MGNPQKSWKGAPTTNLIDVSENLLDAKWTKESGFGTVTANYGNAPDGAKTSTRLQYSSGYFYRRTTTSPAITALTPGTIITFSCWVKGTAQPGRGIGLWSYAVGGIVAASNQSINQSSWTRVSLTYTIAAGATSFAIMLAGAPGNIFQGDIEVWRPQLEVGSFATPYVNGTRSNTQAILDLTNNNTITATSLAYASDGTFSFDGSANKVELFTSNSFISNGFTLSAFIKPLSAGGASFGRIFDKTNNDTGSAAGVFLYMNANPIVTLQINNGNSITTTSNSVPYSVWTNITATVTGSGNSVIYINGISNVSATLSLPNTITNTLPLTLGNRANATDRGFSGNISIATIYNRALSAAEVQQNFNALRGRYGL
jgi:hypothetical protein